jgi:hypothetical protein
LRPPASASLIACERATLSAWCCCHTTAAAASMVTAVTASYAGSCSSTSLAVSWATGPNQCAAISYSIQAVRIPARPAASLRGDFDSRGCQPVERRKMRLGHASSVHTNGDSWDFVAIAPEPTKAQDAKVDELTRQKGLKTGFAAALAFSPVHCLPHRYVCRWSSVSGRSRQDGRAQSKRFN